MTAKRLFRALALAIFVTGSLVAAIPTNAIASTCTADSGASCSCSGSCEAGAIYCWCKPPKK